MKNEIRYGFIEITMLVVIISMTIIMALSAILYYKVGKLNEKDEVIRTMNSNKVIDFTVSENKIFETEQETIAKQTYKGVINEKLDLSIGKHTYTFTK